MKCNMCDGKGTLVIEHEKHDCYICEGHGEIENCTTCKGIGESIVEGKSKFEFSPCMICMGNGVRPKTDTCYLCGGKGILITPFHAAEEIEYDVSPCDCSYQENRE
tara:strand:- start:64 stop:381 length:318 start_codon:yes stop_codon:yes gene_type:complete